MKKLCKNKYFLAFLCSLILGCIIILPFIIIGKGVLAIWADYNVQQIPFGEIMNHSLKEGIVVSIASIIIYIGLLDSNKKARVIIK